MSGICCARLVPIDTGIVATLSGIKMSDHDVIAAVIPASHAMM